MDVRNIVRKAWQITQVHLKKLIWYGAIPSFFTIVISSIYLTYQYEAFKSSALFSDTSTHGAFKLEYLEWVWSFITSHPAITISFIVFAALFVLGYILIPPIFHGALIQAMMRIRNYEPISGSMEVGIRHFFPMFEFGLLTGTFSVTTLFTEGSFVLRWWGENIFFFILPVLLFVAMVGLIASFLFTYSEFFIVLEDHNIIASIKESVVLVIANLRKTILVFILMILIGARIILNVLLVLLIPMILIVLSTYLAATFLGTLGIVISGILALVVTVMASYLMGLFHVFATGVWVLTFAELTHHKKTNSESTSDSSN